MKERVKIYSKSWISLVIPELEDAEVWYQWISKPEINQYIGPLFWKLYSRESQEEYCKGLNKDWKNIVFFIYDEEKKEVIWNVELFNIDYVTRKAWLGIIILDLDNTSKWTWKSAVWMILDHAFKILWLNKVYLSVLWTNIRAIKCYEKCKFKEVWRYRDHWYRMWWYHDEVLMEVFNKSK